MTKKYFKDTKTLNQLRIYFLRKKKTHPKQHKLTRNSHTHTAIET